MRTRCTTSLPRTAVNPVRAVLQRLLIATGIMAATVLIVGLDREGYRDSTDNSVSWLDSLYYATVTLSTTGYGDIVPASDAARLINVLVITPLRMLFLIVLVGTTLEVLAERTREQWTTNRWRNSLRDHTIIVGYGAKGRGAVKTLLGSGFAKEQLVVVDSDHDALATANSVGLAVVFGDATHGDVLREARADRARRIVISVNRDDAAVLTTLTARQLNPGANIVVAVRESENAALLRQGGADTVIVSSEAAGQLLGVSTISPHVVSTLNDMMLYGGGMDLVERPATKPEAGTSPRDCEDLVVAIVRGSRVLRFDDGEAAKIKLTDRLIVVKSQPKPSEVTQ